MSGLLVRCGCRPEGARVPRDGAGLPQRLHPALKPVTLCQSGGGGVGGRDRDRDRDRRRVAGEGGKRDRHGDGGREGDERHSKMEGRRASALGRTALKTELGPDLRLEPPATQTSFCALSQSPALSGSCFLSSTYDEDMFSSMRLLQCQPPFLGRRNRQGARPRRTFQLCSGSARERFQLSSEIL